MTLVSRTGTARFYDLGGRLEAPVDSRCQLRLPGWAGSIGPNVNNPTYWQSDPDVPVPLGLMRQTGPAFGGRLYSEIHIDGDGDDLGMYISLSFGYIGGPGSLGRTITTTFTVFKNDIAWQQGSDSFVCGGFFCSHQFDWVFDVPSGLSLAAGDVLTAGFSYDWPAGLAVFPPGTGQQLHWKVFGPLTAPARAPGQPPMRLHGAVAETY